MPKELSPSFLSIRQLKNIFFWSLFLFSTAELRAENCSKQPVLDLTGYHQILTLEKKYLQFYLDYDLSKEDFFFQQQNQDTFTHSFSNGAVYLRFCLLNQHERNILWLILDTLMLKEVQLSYEIHGKTYLEIIKETDLPEQRHFYSHYFGFKIPISADKPLSITLRVTSDKAFFLPLRIGTYEEFSRIVERRENLSWVFLGMVIAVFFYNLFLFFSLKEKIFVPYLVFVLSIGSFALCLSGVFAVLFPKLWHHHSALLLVVLPAISTSCLTFFSFSFLSIKKLFPRIYLFGFLLHLFNITAIALTGSGFFLAGQFLAYSVVLFLALTLLVLSIVLSLRKVEGALYFLLAFSLVFLSGIILVLGYANVVPRGGYERYLVFIASGVEMVLFSFALGNRFRLLKKENKQKQFEIYELQSSQHKKLEIEVTARTHNLNVALAEIRDLKIRQDLDYFLTSQLVNPLNQNQVKSSTVLIETFLQQKKVFSYRNIDRQIGGDYFRCCQLWIEDRSYILFLNADAMGKSLQGASGVLVLGSVVEANIDRHQTMRPVNMSPERFLKNLMLELHSIFETFQGSMLVSLVVGLIDEKSGLIHYLNIEHPPLILFRNGKCLQLENINQYHKIGRKNLIQIYYLETLQLRDQDVLFLGSDGKDELLLKKNQVRNDDLGYFSHLVEKNGGNLDAITKNMEADAEFVDDVSLLRISFQLDLNYRREFFERFRNKITVDKIFFNKIKQACIHKKKSYSFQKKLVEALEFFSQADNPVLNHAVWNFQDKAKWAIKKLRKIALYDIAVDLGQLYLSYFPGDEEILFLTATVARMNRELNRAINLSEKLRLRNPSNLENNLNLIKAYIAEQNPKQAVVIACLALNFSPRSYRLRSMQKTLFELIKS